MSGKILLIDDDKVNSHIVMRKLVSQGFTVNTCHNPKEFWAYHKSFSPQLILMDIVMPEMSGIELLSDIRKQFNQNELPVIMLTAKGASEDIVLALEHEANDYLTKPLDISVATSRINNQLNYLKLQRAQEQKAKQETLNAMIVTYNHEINNPLTIAIGSLELLKNNHKDLADDKNITRITYALHRMQDIVQAIKELTEQEEFETTNYSLNSKMIKINKKE